MEIKDLNIYQKLVEVRKKVEFLKKEAGTQYKYVSSSKVLMSIRQYLDEYNLLLIPECCNSEITSYEKDKDGKVIVTYFTKAQMTMTWVNCDKSEEKISVKWEGHGVDIAGEKGIGKAYTYAEKYFLLKQFNIPTDKLDPDVIANQINNDNGTAAKLKEEIKYMKEEYSKLADVFKKLKDEYTKLKGGKEEDLEHKMVEKQENSNKEKWTPDLNNIASLAEESKLSSDDLIKLVKALFTKSELLKLTKNEESKLVEYLNVKILANKAKVPQTEFIKYIKSMFGKRNYFALTNEEKEKLNEDLEKMCKPNV